MNSVSYEMAHNIYNIFLSWFAAGNPSTLLNRYFLIQALQDKDGSLVVQKMTYMKYEKKSTQWILFEQSGSLFSEEDFCAHEQVYEYSEEGKESYYWLDTEKLIKQSHKAGKERKYVDACNEALREIVTNLAYDGRAIITYFGAHELLQKERFTLENCQLLRFIHSVFCLAQEKNCQKDKKLLQNKTKELYATYAANCLYKDSLYSKKDLLYHATRLADEIIPSYNDPSYVSQVEHIMQQKVVLIEPEILSHFTGKHVYRAPYSLQDISTIMPLSCMYDIWRNHHQDQAAVHALSALLYLRDKHYKGMVDDVEKLAPLSCIEYMWLSVYEHFDPISGIHTILNDIVTTHIPRFYESHADDLHNTEQLLFDLDDMIYEQVGKNDTKMYYLFACAAILHEIYMHTKSCPPPSE